MPHARKLQTSFVGTVEQPDQKHRIGLLLQHLTDLVRCRVEFDGGGGQARILRAHLFELAVDGGDRLGRVGLGMCGGRWPFAIRVLSSRWTPSCFA
ncbi:MAG TPA: hypothetical protein VN153_13245, partial [Tahibacter sp.]|nr:hypothetical protein [Tahibacter sp.]